MTSVNHCLLVTLSPSTSNLFLLVELSRRSMSFRPRPWSLIARKEDAFASSLYLFSLANGSEHSLFSAISTPRSRIHRFEGGITASPRSLSPVRSHNSAGLRSIEAVLRGSKCLLISLPYAPRQELILTPSLLLPLFIRRNNRSSQRRKESRSST